MAKKAKRSHAFWADLGAGAVAPPMARSGVVHRNPAARRKTGPQHVAGLRDEGLLASDEKPHHLTFRDGQAQRLQECRQAPHRGLALVVLGQDEPLELRPEVPVDTAGQRRDDRAPVRCQPALAQVAHHPGLDRQVLDREGLEALEARSRRNALGLHHPLLVGGGQPLAAAPLALAIPALGPLPIRRLVQARRLRRLDVRLAFQPLEPRHLVAQRRVLRRQTGVLLQQPDRQRLEGKGRQRVNIRERFGHAPTES